MIHDEKNNRPSLLQVMINDAFYDKCSKLADYEPVPFHRSFFNLLIRFARLINKSYYGLQHKTFKLIISQLKQHAVEQLLQKGGQYYSQIGSS